MSCHRSAKSLLLASRQRAAGKLRRCERQELRKQAFLLQRDIVQRDVERHRLFTFAWSFGWFVAFHGLLIWHTARVIGG